MLFVCLCFAHKKYSRRFITLSLNHWSNINYFNYYVFTTFLGLESGRCIAVCGGLRKLSDFIKNTFICVLKMNGGLQVWNDMRVNNK